MGEKWTVTWTESCDLHAYATWDKRLYFPSEGRRAEDFFSALKNPTASAGFELANFGTRGQHATSRLPKPLQLAVTSVHIWSNSHLDNLDLSVFFFAVCMDNHDRNGPSPRRFTARSDRPCPEILVTSTTPQSQFERYS